MKFQNENDSSLGAIFLGGASIDFWGGTDLVARCRWRRRFLSRRRRVGRCNWSSFGCALTSPKRKQVRRMCKILAHGDAGQRGQWHAFPFGFAQRHTSWRCTVAQNPAHAPSVEWLISWKCSAAQALGLCQIRSKQRTIRHAALRSPPAPAFPKLSTLFKFLLRSCFYVAKTSRALKEPEMLLKAPPSPLPPPSSC